MSYQIGDTVVHWTHGIGKIIAIDEKWLSGSRHQYYVVRAGLMDLWVPAGTSDEEALRLPIEGTEFLRLLDSMKSSGEILHDNPYKRKLELRERMQKRTLQDLCNLVRDLAYRSRNHNLNENDQAVLLRAEEFLLDEWVFSLGSEREAAQSELDGLLKRGSPQADQ